MFQETGGTTTLEIDEVAKADGVSNADRLVEAFRPPAEGNGKTHRPIFDNDRSQL